MPSTMKSYSSPLARMSFALTPFLFQVRSVLPTKPSTPSSISTNAPWFVRVTTLPETRSPFWYFSVMVSQGSARQLLEPERNLALRAVDVKDDEVLLLAELQDLPLLEHLFPRHVVPVQQRVKALDPDEYSELDVLDALALDDVARLVLGGEFFPPRLDLLVQVVLAGQDDRFFLLIDALDLENVFLVRLVLVLQIGGKGKGEKGEDAAAVDQLALVDGALDLSGNGGAVRRHAPP